jgi:hypothetical protein
MDQDFQTSFIPKKTVEPQKTRMKTSPGILNTVSFVLLVVSVVMAGGVYLYRDNLSKRVDEMRTSLDRARNIFEPTLLADLQVLDRRIDAATEILQGHLAVSPIFKVLQDITLPTVRYIDFTYEIDAINPNVVHVTMTGEAISYDVITLQSDLFSQNRFIRNPIFSNFALDQDGRIDFELTFDVSRSLVSFEQEVERSQLGQ